MMLRGAVVTLLAAAALGVPAPAAARPADPDSHWFPRAAAAPVLRRAAVPVTVMSFNACGGVCRRGEIRRTAAGIVGTAASHRASVILLQELCHAQFTAVRKSLPGWSGRFAAQTTTKGCGRDRRFGVAVLTRGKLSGATVERLPTTAGSEARLLLGATAVIGGRRTFVAVVHLSPSADEGRQAQLAAVARHLRPRERSPMIVGGDFNSMPANPGLRSFYGSMTELDRTKAPTFDLHRRKIDYIFVSPGWFSGPRARSLPTTLSDHRVYLGTTHVTGG